MRALGSLFLLLFLPGALLAKPTGRAGFEDLELARALARVGELAGCVRVLSQRNEPQDQAIPLKAYCQYKLRQISSKNLSETLAMYLEAGGEPTLLVQELAASLSGVPTADRLANGLSGPGHSRLPRDPLERTLSSDAALLGNRRARAVEIASMPTLSPGLIPSWGTLRRAALVMSSWQSRPGLARSILMGLESTFLPRDRTLARAAVAACLLEIAEKGPQALLSLIPNYPRDREPDLWSLPAGPLGVALRRYLQQRRLSLFEWASPLPGQGLEVTGPERLSRKEARLVGLVFGFVALAQRDMEEAGRCFQAVWREFPGDGQASLGLGVLHRAKGDFDRAWENLAAASHVLIDSLEPRALLAQVELDRGQVDAAHDLLLELEKELRETGASRFTPRSRDTLLAVARSHARVTGDPDLLRRLLESMHREDLLSREDMVILGKLYRDAGEEDRAADLYREAAVLALHHGVDPHSRGPLINLALRFNPDDEAMAEARRNLEEEIELRRRGSRQVPVRGASRKTLTALTDALLSGLVAVRAHRGDPLGAARRLETLLLQTERKRFAYWTAGQYRQHTLLHFRYLLEAGLHDRALDRAVQLLASRVRHDTPRGLVSYYRGLAEAALQARLGSHLTTDGRGSSISHEMGVVLARRGYLEEASLRFRDLLAHPSASPRIWSTAVKCALSLGRPRHAARLVLEWRNEEGNEEGTWRAREWVMHFVRDMEKSGLAVALDAVREGVQRTGEAELHPAWWALQAREAALSGEVGREAVFLREAAVSALGMGEPEVARHLLRKLEEKHPRPPPPPRQGEAEVLSLAFERAYDGPSASQLAESERALGLRRAAAYAVLAGDGPRARKLIQRSRDVEGRRPPQDELAAVHPDAHGRQKDAPPWGPMGLAVLLGLICVEALLRGLTLLDRS